ncbi:MAG: hypothetical protein CVV51_05805 [Spirochaetae bacterium HGW-Spirochaetae-7]|nr:MAG: hypothetical protein CVV51_05805 [Spirochaetae bacterium HGW-Spirochaetae-7]
MRDDIVRWLLEDADPSLEYQTRRDLVGQPAVELSALRRDIGSRGWTRALLDRRGPDGHWGNGAYNPKWTCTHYVLYELAQLELPPGDPRCAESARLLLSYPRGRDGGVNYAKTVDYSDVCVNGMLLGIAARFIVGDGGAGARTPDEAAIDDLVDYLLSKRMDDGGWNCAYYQGGTRSSLHTTIAVVEGLLSFIDSGRSHRATEVRSAVGSAVEFILRHRLCRSERTGEVIADEFFKFPFPVRWKYDILRCLDLFRRHGIPYDPGMDEALDRLATARGRDGRWKAASQAGATYLVVEANGKPGKWNTLRALRVLERYGRAGT